MKKELLLKNLGVCCVCKERGIGTHFHHIDENPSNNSSDNIAVLCVKDHDFHHRPKKYPVLNHLELSANEIIKFKKEWELTVNESGKDNPKIVAVINCFGTKELIHSVKLAFQNDEGKIVLERTYHILNADFDKITDSLFEELGWLGENIKLTIIDEPISIEYCPCGGGAFTQVLDKSILKKYTDSDWNTKSLMTIYINPNQPSLAFTIFYEKEDIFSGSIHKCEKKHLHYHDRSNFDERMIITNRPSIRTQTTKIIQKVISTWEPSKIMIGTGDHDKPKIIENFELPELWESR
jgi:hypothetical protein